MVINLVVKNVSVAQLVEHCRILCQISRMVRQQICNLPKTVKGLIGFDSLIWLQKNNIERGYESKNKGVKIKE